jgi:outer membrane protein assembly factor BamB
VVLAISRKDGKVLWQRVVREELPHEGVHPTGSFAANSAATDGQRVYAFFGSRGVYALDMTGKVVWEKDLGDMNVKMGFGEGSSPALHGDRLVVNWDHEGESFIVALDTGTGKELWRTPRQERTSWATPLVVEHGGRAQVITSATAKVRSYDLADGKLLWETAGMTDNAIPTPVQAGGVVYITSGFRGNALLAVKLAEAKGDITGGTAIAWRLDRDTPYVPSPLLYDGQLYILKSNSGVLACLDAKTGQKHYGEQRLEGVPNVYASPVGAGGRVYVAGREGATAVLQAGPQFKLIAVNQLEDGFDASPAVVDGELYLRGRKFLYRISKD